MTIDGKAKKDIGDAPITTNTIIKWSGIIGTAVTAVVAVVWAFASSSTSVSLIAHNLETETRERVAYQDKTDKVIEKLTEQVVETNKNASEMGRKLDVAVAILQRMERDRWGEKE